MAALHENMSIPLPEGGRVDIKFPTNITAASIGMIAEMLTQHSLRYLIAEENVAIAASQSAGAEGVNE